MDTGLYFLVNSAWSNFVILISIRGSAVPEKRELISGEAVIRTDIPKLNKEKSMYRRNRRDKLWYRKPRFMNRGNKKKGWLAPSIDHKLQTHIRLIEFGYISSCDSFS